MCAGDTRVYRPAETPFTNFALVSKLQLKLDSGLLRLRD